MVSTPQVAAGGLQPGQIIDRYVIEAILGRGGMAVVYRVRHQQLGSLHALKILTLQSQGLRQRLLQEGRVQASLRHPNVVAVTDVLDVDGAPGLVMEFVEGPSLDQWLAENRPTPDQIDLIFRSIVSGVAAAHENGLVHRDLKPANVLMMPASGGYIPKVADFGLAKALQDEDGGMKRTRSGVTMGTPQYMAPEQIRDAKNVDARADVFSLGCILYELIAGTPPFHGEDLLAIFNAVAAGKYQPIAEVAPEVPPRFVQAITGCLQTDREQRLPSCAALLEVFGGGSLTGLVPIARPSATVAPPGTQAGAPTFHTDAPLSLPAPESQAPRSSAPASLSGSLSGSSPGPTSSGSIVTGKRVAVAAGVGGATLALAAVGVIGLLVVGVGGYVAYGAWTARQAGAMAAAYDVVAAAEAIEGGVRLTDVTFGDGALTAREATLFGPNASTIEKARIDGLRGTLPVGHLGVTWPSTAARLDEQPLALPELQLPDAEVTLHGADGDLTVAWRGLTLTSVSLGGAEGVRAATLRGEGLVVRGADPILTAQAWTLDADGVLTLDSPELWVRSRQDGLLDAPPMLRDVIPAWLGGASDERPWWGADLSWLPAEVRSVQVRDGQIHVIDRANALATATWTFESVQGTVGPLSSGTGDRLPFAWNGRIGDATAGIDGDLRKDGLLRAAVRVRELPVADFEPYLAASLQRHGLAPKTGALTAEAAFSVQAGQMVAVLDGQWSDVAFRSTGSRPPAAMTSSRASVPVSSTPEGSLADGSFAPVNQMLRALADALFKPVGGADWRAPVASTPSKPSSPRPPAVDSPVSAIATERPTTDVREGPVTRPDPAEPAAEAPVDPDAPPPLTVEERVEKARVQVEKANKDVKQALDELRFPGRPPGR